MEAIVQAGIRKSRGIMLKKGQLVLNISRNSFSQACLRDLLGLHKSVTPLAVAYSVLHCICLSALASTSPPTLIYFLSVGSKHCDFFFFFLWCIANPPLCKCNSGTKFTHTHS